jgi:hypothetical protein
MYHGKCERSGTSKLSLQTADVKYVFYLLNNDVTFLKNLINYVQGINKNNIYLYCDDDD